MSKVQLSENLRNMLDINTVLRVSIDRRRYGKYMTVISGLENSDADIKELTKILKRNIATGGTYKDGKIELQGDHSEKVKKLLEELGYTVESS
ncbi:MAG: stress response translation initiation inhibitor YciH [Thermoplasmata archaeon]